MAETIDRIEAFALRIPRNIPYLGALEDGVAVNHHGYFVRSKNKTLYPAADQSVLVKITSSGGAIGWGECFASVAPHVVSHLINTIIGPFLIGRDPADVSVIYEDMYDMMRVRGFFGGFYVDSLAGIDIALWDLKGKLAGQSVAKLLGGVRNTKLPCYVSGLPKPTLPERAALAGEYVNRGFRAVKFAAAVSFEGEVAEMKALRDSVGPDVQILCDMHWQHTAHQAIKIINAMDAYDLAVAEAPVNAEDQEGQAHVSAAVAVPVAIGEELRTRYEFRPRFVNRCMSIVQPDVAHTGITEFMNICRMAAGFHCQVMPHATIGLGLQQAASLQCAATLANSPLQEYQHSVFDKNLQFVDTDMKVEAGFFHLPTGPGIGAEPTPEVFDLVFDA
ncbi:MAG: mandelate racemase/muconate lactonizing enzyme family protein [Rhodospirillales bacterium]|nr:mandelate racemase/muconate lactonizing enzyme family protein [Rhodospirillales bacterium]